MSELYCSFGQATLYLYSTGLCHIHSGNVYVDVEKDICLLGDYENRLLGYRTRLYNGASLIKSRLS